MTRVPGIVSLIFELYDPLGRSSSAPSIPHWKSVPPAYIREQGRSKRRVAFKYSPSDL